VHRAADIRAPVQPPASAHLPRYLATAYTLLVIYASLHPFTGWQDHGAEVFAYLSAPWPRYWTVFDLITNALAYLPIGFLWASALQNRCGHGCAVMLAVLLGVLLSLTLETVQNYLPSRVASNVDLATNGLGVLLGALMGWRWGAALLDGGRLHALNLRLFGEGAWAHSGLVLLGLWLLTQLNPEILLFGNGDMRGFLEKMGWLETPAYVVEHFPWVEASVTASNTLAVGLLASCLLRTHPRLLGLALIVAALLMKTLSLTVLTSTASVAWATQGNLAGLGGGLLLWWIASFLPRFLCQALAALALMLATTLVNLAPENPYLVTTLQTWQQGHFLNFNGLTRLSSVLWPFLALPWLMLQRDERNDPPRT
jgi:VanZ family protein